MHIGITDSITDMTNGNTCITDRTSIVYYSKFVYTMDLARVKRHYYNVTCTCTCISSLSRVICSIVLVTIHIVNVIKNIHIEKVH